MMKQRICFIGAGNLATHLSRVLYKKGYNISQIYSRSEESSKLLASELNTCYTNKIHLIDDSADIFFVALKDSVIEDVLSKINFKDKLVIHCSGSLPMSVLEDYSRNIGVFYPLQTFSKNRVINFTDIPVFIESNTNGNEKVLIEIGSEISNSVSKLSSEKRKYLHISAVFACNFVNHFYNIAAKTLETKNLPFDIIRPLILETALKVQEMKPEQAQTGPAVRFDENIINSHMKELEGMNNYSELYNSISKSIFEHHSIK